MTKSIKNRTWNFNTVLIILSILFITALPVSLSAADTQPVFGILASTNGERYSTGFIYDFSQDFSIKPQFTFYQLNTALKTYGAALQFDLNSVIAGNFSILYGIGFEYLYDYRHYHNTDSIQTYTDHDYSASIIIGARYMLNERFGFFADTGFSYTLEKSKDESIDTSSVKTIDNSTYHIFRIRSAGLGAVFYLF